MASTSLSAAKRHRISGARSLVALALGWLLAGAGPVPVIRQIPAEEAWQGVASDGRHVYAIDNRRIGKYRIADGVRVAEWRGDPALIPHLNSCTIARRRLVCASSNYPAVPQASSVEFFDPRTVRHVGSHSFGIAEGSLTAFDWHRGSWWAVFAHYDGKGGVPGVDHRHSQLVQFDAAFRPMQRWTFPAAVLERMKPYSASGASWSAAGQLAISGHDRPEIYLLMLPAAGSMLRLDGIVDIASEGQAIDWDPQKPTRLWSISRARRVLMQSDFGPAPGNR